MKKLIALAFLFVSTASVGSVITDLTTANTFYATGNYGTVTVTDRAGGGVDFEVAVNTALPAFANAKISEFAVNIVDGSLDPITSANFTLPTHWGVRTNRNVSSLGRYDFLLSATSNAFVNNLVFSVDKGDVYDWVTALALTPSNTQNFIAHILRIDGEDFYGENAPTSAFIGGVCSGDVCSGNRDITFPVGEPDGPPQVAISEPATLALFLLGLTAFGVRRTHPVAT